MKKLAKKLFVIAVVTLLISSTVFVTSAFAIDGILSADEATVEPVVLSQTADDSDAAEPALLVYCDHLSVTVGENVQFTAEVTGVDTQPKINWHTDDKDFIKIDANGKATALRAGKVTVTAKATVNGVELEDSFVLSIETQKNIIKTYLTNNQVLSYKYSYTDDYYYTNDKKCWQSNCGYGKVYDIVAPYVLLEYDYVRVYFTYQDREWMIQLWKGQYGMVFYGSEIGIYTKKVDNEEDGIFTMYACAREDEWMPMQMTLYRDEENNGNYVRQFEREYGEYWWCTGFKDGHLRREEPASELRMTGRITLKDAEMTKLFTEGLAECGFGQSESMENLGLDEFYVDGCDVHFAWQNISEAENTMPIKIGAGALIFVNILAFILMLLALGATGFMFLIFI